MGKVILTRPSRAQRGVTLITTVLLSVLAATVAIVMVRQVMLATGADSGTVANLVVDRTADNVRVLFEQELRDDPQFYLTRTFAHERPRKCFASSPEMIAGKWLVPTGGAQAGQPWPTECGNVWEYPPVTEPGVAAGIVASQGGFVTAGGVSESSWDPVADPVRTEVIPPGARNAFLTLRVLAAGGTQEGGLTATYARDTANNWTLYSPGDVLLDRVGGGSGLGEGGRVYAGGALITGTDQFPPGTLLASETSVSGPGFDTAAAYATLVGDGPRWVNVRELAPQRLTLAGLRSSFASIRAAGCGGNAAGNITVGNTVFSPRVCLEEGNTLTAINGDTVPVPDGVRSWLLVARDEPGGAVADVYYTPADVVFVRDCAVVCDLASVAARASVLGADPAAELDSAGSPWLKLASTYLPLTGVLWAEQDVFVSHPRTPSVVGASVTVATEGDVFLSGAVDTAGGAVLGVVAGGNVQVPYFATAAGDVEVQAMVAALGEGAWSVPQSRVREGTARGKFTLVGSLAAGRVGGFPAVDEFTLTGVRGAGSAPMFAAFSPAWGVSSVAVLSSGQVCGGQSCVGVW